MKKRLPVFLVIILFFSILQIGCFANGTNFIKDDSTIFNAEQKKSLSDQIEKSEIKLYIKTDSRINDPIAARDELINNLSIDNSSAVLLLDMQNRKAYLYFGKDVGSNFTEKEILDKYFIPYAKEQKFYDGILNLIAGIQKDAFVVNRSNNSSQKTLPQESSDNTLNEVTQYLNLYYYGFLLLYLLILIIVIVLVHRFISNRKKKKAEIARNIQLIDEYYQDVSQRIVDLDEKVPYLNLTDDYRGIQEKYDEAVLNFSRLKEYYDGVKSSYTESEFRTFVNIYKIIKSDLDFIEEAIKRTQSENKSEHKSEGKDNENSKKAILDRFLKIKEQYDKEDFKCYRIDLKIEEISNLLEKDSDIKKAESLIDELDDIIRSFRKDVDDCKRLLEDYSGFLEKSKGRLFFKMDYENMKSYENELKKLLYECRFDEFRKRYVEVEQIARNLIQKNFSQQSDIFNSEKYRGAFDGTIPFILFGMLSSIINDSIFHDHHHHHKTPFDGGFFGNSSSWCGPNQDSGGWSSDGGKFDSGNDSNSSSW